MKSETYEKAEPLDIMKTEKQIRSLKMKLVERLKPADSTYYGLSLENLIASN
ncbi:MAG: hypothetical protein GKS07_08770 [Nitrosopumilus sp.]|nr:MAG: hypothetical protein GKS07_08770 [Nitrosopumilus sp.]